MPTSIDPGKRYRHYQNQLTYIVVGLAHNPNTHEVIVIYRPCSSKESVNAVLHWRPVMEFMQKFKEV